VGDRVVVATPMASDWQHEIVSRSPAVGPCARVRPAAAFCQVCRGAHADHSGLQRCAACTVLSAAKSAWMQREAEQGPSGPRSFHLQQQP